METWFALLGGCLALASAPLPTPQSSADQDRAIFAEPEPLLEGKLVLGAKLRYPSPRLYDLDGDGAAEMVVGDLSGRLHVATKRNGGSGRRWNKLAPLTTDGTELKFHNW
ncbi:MAG: hypothetical protein ACJA2W_001912 [Planctomycetota bacterium]|jgi:hypothetical protein